MRVVVDTNILVSALISRSAPTDRLYVAWQEHRYELITSDDQLEEFRCVTRYQGVAKLIDRSAAGAMYNHMCASNIVLGKLPTINRSRDPADNFLLAMAEAGMADYLVTGDKRDVLALKKHGRTRILNVRRMVTVLAMTV